MNIMLQNTHEFISNLFKFVVLKDPKCSYKEWVCEISLVHVILQTLKFLYLSYPKGNKVWHLIFDTFDSKLPIIEDTL